MSVSLIMLFLVACGDTATTTGGDASAEAGDVAALADALSEELSPDGLGQGDAEGRPSWPVTTSMTASVTSRSTAPLAPTSMTAKTPVMTRRCSGSTAPPARFESP